MTKPDASGSSLTQLSNQNNWLHSTERRSTTLVAIIVFLALTFASFGLLFLSSLLGQLDLTIIYDPARWLRELSTSAALDILSTSTELLAGVLAVSITVVAIVVELAATRYSHRITKHFIAEPVNIAVMSLFLLTTIQSVWLAAILDDSVSSALLPNAGIGIHMLMETLSLLILLPSFYFVFSFISPLSIIQKLQADAQRIFARVSKNSAKRLQVSLLDVVDELQDIARSAADQGDTRISMAAVDALADLILEYTKVSEDLPDEWFVIDESIAHDPDFVSLAPNALEEMREARYGSRSKLFANTSRSLTRQYPVRVTLRI